MKKQPEPYLHHILDAIAKIEQYTKSIDFDHFLQHSMIQDAVIRQLEIIGEAAARLEKNFRNSKPDIPWRLVSDTRNKLIHEYWNINLKKIHNIILKDLPRLKTQVRALLKKL